MSTTQAVSVHEVREAIKPLHFDDAPIQQSQQGGRDYITVRSPINTSEAIEKQIMQAMPGAGFKVDRSERVGALVGGELAKSSLWALGLGILGILIYVTLRFELSFAVGAIVALLHDVLITVGVFSLLGRELTLTMVGAVLTIAGYSINDTIVVYDRIREGLASGRKGTIEQIMNDEHQSDAQSYPAHQRRHLDPDPMPLLLRRFRPARLCPRDHHWRARRHLFLHFHRLADRSLVDKSTQWREQRPTSRSGPKGYLDCPHRLPARNVIHQS